MPCIAGKQEEPKEWVRFVGGEAVEQHGRLCQRTQWRTDRTACSSCPAFRGRRWDGTTATGLNADGSPYGLTPEEFDRWAEAMEAALLEDDFTLVARFEDSMAGGVGERTLVRIGDPDATERWAARMREYRAAWRREGRTPRRKRTAYMREYMRKKRSLLAVSTPGTGQRAASVKDDLGTHARAREARGANG